MADEQNTPTKTSWLSHPLTSVLIGFILTGVVGSLITQHFFDRRQAEQLRAKFIENRQKVIESVSRYTIERLTRTELFVNALTSTAPTSDKNLHKRKEQYDEAYLKWKTESSVVLLIAKDLLSPSGYQLFQRYLEVKLHQNMLTPAHACMQQAYTNRAQMEQARQILTDCRIETLLQQANACVKALTELLHELTADGAGVGQKTAAQRAKLSQEIDEQCS